ncbi:MAG: hypothetical protein JST68_05870 [Bacteroidetes bacterium]|nr:hypothetical protein [Bacteroidota bacterium]
MLSIRQYLCITLLLFSISTQAQPSLPQSYNVVWTTPSHNSSESMPCGGGDIGLNVWVENGDLLLYFCRSGSFDENNALLKGGRIRIRLNPNPFQDTQFRQELLLQDGHILITSKNTKIRIWVDVFHPIVHIDCAGDHPFQTTATYESWRTTDREMTGRANNANSYKWAPKHAPGGKVFTYRDSIRFQDNNVVFYHHNQPGPNIFDVTVHQQGLDSVKSLLPNPLKDLTFGGQLSGTNLHPSGTTQGRYLDTDFTGWQLTSTKARRIQNITLTLATTTQSWEDTLAATTRQSSSLTATTKWWHDFWQRSFIYIQPESSPPTPEAATSPQWQAARNYQLLRYMLACNAFGRYPTKFNGGLFTYDPSLTDTSLHYTPDFRNWGGGTMTAQNQRLVYFPMTRSGDFDLQKNQLDYYVHLLPAAEARTRVYWNHTGASFTEQLENFGLPNSAEYGWDMPANHDKGVEYNAWLEYEWDTVLEFCLMMLDRERYTGADIHEYLPFIQSCLTFFSEHYQYLAAHRGRRSLDGEGHLILYPGSGGETYKMAYNSSSTIAGLHTILTRLLQLPKTYLDDSARHTYTTMLGRLPSLSFRTVNGHPTIAPARSWERINNKESTQLYPVYPWGLYGIGKPGLDTAINTFKYDTDAISFRSHIGWKQDNIFAARLGLTTEAADLTIKKLQDAPRRFPAFWGPGFDWTPDHNWGGSGMIGLQEMLLQTDDEKIYLLPAWPRDWDVHFKLYAPYSTTIECTLKNGKIESLKVEPESRRKDIIKTF